MKQYWIVNQLDNATAEILLYGYIGEYDVTASEFVKELRTLEKENSKINVRINSGGGSVFDGFTIYNAIKQSKATIDTYVDGVAASMGTIIALAGNKVYMSKVARFMTHKPSGFAAGTANEMRKNATLLEGMEKTMLSIYTSKTGLSDEEAKAKYLNDSDTWFTAEEAVAEKLVDAIYDGEAIDLPVKPKDEKAMWDCYNSKFQSVFINSNENMKQLFLSPSAMTALGLNDSSDVTIVENTIKSIVAEAAKVPGLNDQLSSATTAKETAETALQSLKDATTAKEVADLIAGGLNDKKITAKLGDVLKAQYAGKPTELKALLEATPVYKGLTAEIAGAAETEELNDLISKDYEVLDKEGKLERLKELSAEQFNAKFKARFNKNYIK